MRISSTLILALLLGGITTSAFAFQATNSEIQYDNNGTITGASIPSPGGLVYSSTGQPSGYAVPPHAATSADISNVLYGNAVYQPFSVLPNGPNAGSANAVNGGSNAYSIVSMTQTLASTVQIVVTPGSGWYPGQPITIVNASACNSSGPIVTVSSSSPTTTFTYLCTSGAPVGTVLSGGYVAVSASSGVTEPAWFMSNVGGTRYLEGFNTSPQGSGTAPTGFLNAQTDWFLNRSAGPPVYAASPLYNWNGTGSATAPGIWADQEGPTGLTGLSPTGNGFPNWGPATRSTYNSCLTNTAASVVAPWSTCHYMANIVSTATGSLHVGHFNPGMQSFIGNNTAAPGTGAQQGTSTNVDSFTYAYTDVPYTTPGANNGSSQDLNGMAINFSYMTGGINYGSPGQTTNQQNMRALSIDLESPTAAQGGGTLSVTSNHYTVGDNFLHADTGICDGINSNKDQGCGWMKGNVGESNGVFTGVVYNHAHDAAPNAFRTILTLSTSTADLNVADSKYTIDTTYEYTAGNILQIQTPSGITYNDGCTGPSCTSTTNTTGIFEITGTSSANWQSFLGNPSTGGTYASNTTYITAPMPSTLQVMHGGNAACTANPTYANCGCEAIGNGTAAYDPITSQSPHTYPSGPMCIVVNSVTGFNQGQDIRIADQTCVDDVQILATQAPGDGATYSALIVGNMRCQHASGFGANVVATGPATGLMFSAGNDTWSSATTSKDTVETWMPVIYSDAEGNIYVWQDNNKQQIANAPFAYRGRAYMNTTAAEDTPASGCSAPTWTFSGGALQSVQGLTCSNLGSFYANHAFNLIMLSAGSTTCSTYPTVYFVGNGSEVDSSSHTSVGGIAVAPGGGGAGCGTGTLTITTGTDIPNPYKVAPGAMTYSVYQNGTQAFGGSSQSPYNQLYLELEANPYATCSVADVDYCYKMPGVSSSAFVDTSTILQAHYMSQTVTKDSQFSEQQFNPSQEVRNISAVNYFGDQGFGQVEATLFSLNNSINNSYVYQLPPGRMARNYYVPSGGSTSWQNVGTVTPMYDALQISGPFQSDIEITQPPAYFTSPGNGYPVEGSALSIWCDDANLAGVGSGAPCKTLGPVSGGAPFYVWKYNPPDKLYQQLANYGVELDVPRNTINEQLNGVNLISVQGAQDTNNHCESDPSAFCPILPSPTHPTMLVSDNGSGLGPVGVVSGGSTATWSIGASTPPTSSCSSTSTTVGYGSIYSDSGSTLYVCKAGSGWVSVGSGGGGSGITALTGDVTASGTGSVVATVTGIQSIPVIATAPDTPPDTASTEALFYNGYNSTYTCPTGTYCPGTANTNLDSHEFPGGGGIPFNNASGAVTPDQNCTLDGSGDINCVIVESSSGMGFISQVSGSGIANSGDINILSQSTAAVDGSTVASGDITLISDAEGASGASTNASGNILILSQATGVGANVSGNILIQTLTSEISNTSEGINISDLAEAGATGGGIDLSTIATGRGSQGGGITIESNGGPFTSLGQGIGGPINIQTGSNSELIGPGGPISIQSGANGGGIFVSNFGAGGFSLSDEYYGWSINAASDGGATFAYANMNGGIASGFDPHPYSGADGIGNLFTNHIIGGQYGGAPQPTTPSGSVCPVAAGTGATCILDGGASDAFFNLTITAGASPTAGAVAVITFGSAYTSTPHCVFSPSQQGSTTSAPYAANAASVALSTYGLTDNSAFATWALYSTLTAGTTYSWDVHCSQ